MGGHLWGLKVQVRKLLAPAQASLVAQLVKNLPSVQETGVRSLGWEDPLEKGVAIHSSILAWRIPWTEEPAGLQSMGSQRVRQNGATNAATAAGSRRVWVISPHVSLLTLPLSPSGSLPDWSFSRLAASLGTLASPSPFW